MAKTAANKEAQKEQEAKNVNVAEVESTPQEESRLPEVKGKMTRAEAEKVVSYYANVDVKGNPADLAEARKILNK